MNISTQSANKLSFLFNLLKITYGMFLIIVGIDKFFDLIVNWIHYVHPNILVFIPYRSLIVAVALLEIFLGLLILLPKVKLGYYAAIVWMVVVIIDLLALGYYDIAARDVLIALGLFTLALLADVNDELT